MYTDFLDDIDEHGGGKLDIAAAAGRVAAPWLIIHGDEDETVAVSEARDLHARAPEETTRLRIVSGASHTFGARHPWVGYTRELRSVVDETVGWFAQHLV